MDFAYTRNRDVSVSAESCFVATDCGMCVPKALPHLDYTTLLGLEYPERVKAVCKLFGIDADINAFSEFDGDPAPVVKLDDNSFVLELWHGPGGSFADHGFVALAPLIDGESKTLVLAEESCVGECCAARAFSPNNSVLAVFDPERTGIVPRMALTSQKSDRVAVVATRYTESVVRRVTDFCKDNGVALVRSGDNIVVTVVQIAYFYSAYCDLVESGEIKRGQKIDFAIPTGTLNNAVSAYYAYKMGLPVNKIVCAENSGVFAEFIATGVFYAAEPEERVTTDMLDGPEHEIERIIYDVSGGNAELTAERMAAFERDGRFTVTEAELQSIRNVFSVAVVEHDDIEAAVADAFDELGYLFDPSGAAAYAAAAEREFAHVTVTLSLSEPFYYAPQLLAALDLPCRGDISDCIARMEDETALTAPQSITDIIVKKEVAAQSDAELDEILRGILAAGRASE